MHYTSCRYFQEKVIQKNKKYYVISTLKEWLGITIFHIIHESFIAEKARFCPPMSKLHGV